MSIRLLINCLLWNYNDFYLTESKTPTMVHQPTAQSHSQNQQQTNQNHQNHQNHQMEKSSPIDRPYLGQTSLLPATSTGTIKSEPYEYSCLQNQSYPYQQIFGFTGGSTGSSEMAYHHQHHVTAAAKLMASS